MTTHYDKKISQTIRLLRRARQIKQLEMALKLDMSESNYSKYENGKLPFLANQLVIIADVLNLSLVQLIAITDASVETNNEIKPQSKLLADTNTKQDMLAGRFSLN